MTKIGYIAQCKLDDVVPKRGTAVRTQIDPTVDTEGFFVQPWHIAARRDADGIMNGWVPGCGGDVWWVEHPGGVVGAYMSTEVFDRVTLDTQPRKGYKGHMTTKPKTTIKAVKVITIELSADEEAVVGPLVEVLTEVNKMSFTKFAGSKTTGHGIHVLLGRIAKACKDASTVH